MNFREPYIQINGILLIVLLSIFAYSYFYPLLAEKDMTVPSACEGMPEMYCKSRGLSRAFAEIAHLHFDKAVSLNKYSISIFSFFVIQFFSRIILSFIYLKSRNNNLILIDSVLSFIYFIYSFFPLTVLYYWIWEK